MTVLFICGGAFDGIEKLIARRLNTQVIGFNAEEKSAVDRDNLLQYLTPQDVKAFGLIPELVGRLPVVANLQPLDLDAMKRIMVEPKNSLVRQYKRMFELEGVKLSFSDNALDYIAQTALDYNLGARGLRSICEAIMNDLMFEIPSAKGEIREFERSEEHTSELQSPC